MQFASVPPTIKRITDIETRYDTTCQTCGNNGYAATNDGGSIGGCTRCNKTYASKAIKYEVTRENGKEVSRRRIGETENTFARRLKESNQRQRRCRQCGLPENNHRAYHRFDDGNGQFNPYSNSLN